jgi:hypothetical protein
MQYLSRTNLPTDALIFFAISAGCANFKWVLQHYGGFRNVCITKQIFLQKLIIQNMTKTLVSLLFSIFFHRAVEKHEHYMTYFLSSANIVL